jgi:ADP-heptose:LPS heptosyltransferase
MKKALFVSYNAMGDTLCTTPALRAFRRNNPDTFIVYVAQNSTFSRVLEGNPDIDLLLFSEILYANRGVQNLGMDWLRMLPLDLEEPASVHHFDLQRAVTKPEHLESHIAMNFARMLGVTLDSTRPTVVVTEAERQAIRPFVRRPYVIFCMNSVTNPPRNSGNGRVKDWPADRWFSLASWLQTEAKLDVIAIGNENEPQYQTPLLRNLFGFPVKLTAALIEGAACLVALENGIVHLAAGLDAPAVVIYCNAFPRGWAEHQGLSRTRVLYGDPEALQWETVRDTVQEILNLNTKITCASAS